MLASAGIFPIRQAAILRNTMSASAIQVTRKLSWEELARPATTIGLSGTRVLRVRVARMSTGAFSDNAACFPGTCHKDEAPTRAPAQAIREHFEGRQAALSNRDVLRGTEWGNHAPRTTLATCPHGCATRCTVDVGRTVQDGVLDAPTEWTVSCDAGGAFSAGHTCHPVKCAVPTLANADILMHTTSTMCLRIRRCD